MSLLRQLCWGHHMFQVMCDDCCQWNDVRFFCISPVVSICCSYRQHWQHLDINVRTNEQACIDSILLSLIWIFVLTALAVMWLRYLLLFIFCCWTTFLALWSVTSAVVPRLRVTYDNCIENPITVSYSSNTSWLSFAVWYLDIVCAHKYLLSRPELDIIPHTDE